jgi:pimeloyl-ACP methyl ester carboxylesterase
LTNVPPIEVDYLEAGSSGPVVMLVHSSVSGARQWRRLMDDLKADFHVRAVNLFGYGKTPPWSTGKTQSLDDQARLVEAALPANADEVYLVGHSFGGSVAMKTAARLPGRVTKLVLLETNPFYLLAQSGRVDAFAEAMEMRNCIKKFGALGEWATAAEKFADYWGGAGSWRDMSSERRTAFAEALKPNFFEWDAVMNETTPVEQWAALLPRTTLLVCDPGTVLPMTVQAMKGGAIEFLTKPFRDQDLLDAIRLGLSRDRARRENENVLADLHGNRFFPVEQFPFENGAGFAATHLNTVVLMQIDDRLRRASGIEIISRGDENCLEWSRQPGRDHVLLDRSVNSDTGVVSFGNDVHRGLVGLDFDDQPRVLPGERCKDGYQRHLKNDAHGIDPQ